MPRKTRRICRKRFPKIPIFQNPSHLYRPPYPVKCKIPKAPENRCGHIASQTIANRSPNAQPVANLSQEQKSRRARLLLNPRLEPPTPSASVPAGGGKARGRPLDKGPLLVHPLLLSASPRAVRCRSPVRSLPGAAFRFALDHGTDRDD